MTMLGLSQSERRRPAAGTRPLRFVFGGIAFELLPPQRARQLELPAALAPFVVPAGSADVRADVLCSLTFDSTLASASAGVGRLEVDTGSAGLPGLSMRGDGVRVELRRVGASRYAASIRIAPDRELIALALRALVGAVAEREGGLMLHAVGVELRGRALLLVGPSGAGKTTACGLIRGARVFAHDHVVVVTSVDGYRAWGLPGGTPSTAPRSDSPSYPLDAVLRVRRGRPRPELQREEAVSRLFIVRESTESVGAVGHLEGARMTSAERVCASAWVGSLYTILGQPLDVRVNAGGEVALVEGARS